MSANENNERAWFQSKKFLAFLLMLGSTVGLLGLGILKGVDPDVLSSMILVLGSATGTAAVAQIGGQSFVDAKARAKK